MEPAPHAAPRNRAEPPDLAKEIVADLLALQLRTASRLSLHVCRRSPEKATEGDWEEFEAFRARAQPVTLDEHCALAAFDHMAKLLKPHVGAIPPDSPILAVLDALRECAPPAEKSKRAAKSGTKSEERPAAERSKTSERLKSGGRSEELPASAERPKPSDRRNYGRFEEHLAGAERPRAAASRPGPKSEGRGRKGRAPKSKGCGRNEWREKTRSDRKDGAPREAPPGGKILTLEHRKQLMAQLVQVGPASVREDCARSAVCPPVSEASFPHLGGVRKSEPGPAAGTPWGKPSKPLPIHVLQPGEAPPASSNAAALGESSPGKAALVASLGLGGPESPKPRGGTESRAAEAAKPSEPAEPAETAEPTKLAEEPAELAEKPELAEEPSEAGAEEPSEAGAEEAGAEEAAKEGAEEAGSAGSAGAAGAAGSAAGPAAGPEEAEPAQVSEPSGAGEEASPARSTKLSSRRWADCSSSGSDAPVDAKASASQDGDGWRTAAPRKRGKPRKERGPKP